MKNTRHILVAPLDWGLGHTTRCVPVIRHLMQSGHRVLFAGNQRQQDYITVTFPGIETIYLEGYNVQYAQSPGMFMPAIARQLPRLLQTIKAEHEWLKGVVSRHKIDAVISDNRYGLHHTGIPCVIMTHQLQPISGWGKFADNNVRSLHYKYLEKFNECWVVDTPDAPGLAGSLSHPTTLLRQAKYMGLLSQQEQCATTGNGYLLVLLSGPEPQRTILADKLWEQLNNYTGKVVFVAGSADAQVPADVPGHITYHQQLTKDDLQQALNGAEIVLCRSGYSTLMDLVKLDKKAILIHTPGQTEQEYLGKTLYEQGVFLSAFQSTFNLEQALAEAKQFPFKKLNYGDAFTQYKSVVDRWVSGL